MLEGSTKPCPMCQGTGMVRSIESVALDILRSIEDRLITDGTVPLVATTAVEVALYILNQKRLHLNDIQQRYRTPITVTADEDMHISQFVIERAADGEIANGGGVVVHMDWAHHQETPAAPAAAPANEDEGEQSRRRSRRRRRGRRHPEGGAEGQRQPHAVAAAEPHDDDDEEEAHAPEPAEPVKGAETREDGGAQARKGPRRRGRRGGRRGRGGQRPHAPGEEGRRDVSVSAETPPQSGTGRAAPPPDSPAQEQPETKQREPEPVFETVAASSEPPAKSSDAQPEPETPRRKGWWQR
jgi:ribonuclease E